MPHYVLDARTATPHFPGIGRYVKNLAQALVPRLAPEEKLTVLHSLAHPVTLPAHQGAHTVPVDISPFSLKQQWYIPRLLRKIHADLYHSAYYLMPYVPGVSTLLTVYDLIPMLFPEHTTIQARLLFHWATKLALRTARHNLAISDASRHDFLQYFRISPEHITSIPLAADPAFQPQSAEQITRVRKRYNLPENFVLYLGSNKPHKNLVRLVTAWMQLVRDTQVSMPLIVAGAWIDRYPEARERAKDATQHILWLGPIPANDLPALYAAATVFVFPSLYEGFGLPVIEAMACGTPVACSNTSSLPEVAGDATVLFDPTSTQAIAAGLASLCHDNTLQSQLRERGFAQARAFSWEKTAQQTLFWYREKIKR